MKAKLLLVTILISLFACSKDDSQTTTAEKVSEQKTINLTIDGNARSFIFSGETNKDSCGISGFIVNRMSIKAL